MPIRSGRAVFAAPDFRRFVAARFLGALAVQVQNVAIGWLVYDLTRSPLALGIVGLAEFLPAVAFALATGHAADRYPRRTILMVCYVIMLLSAGALLGLALTTPGSTVPIYVVLVVFGTARAFANPASQALAPNLVPAADLPAAIAWNASAWQTATIAGPALGGLLYYAGPGAAFGTATLLFGICLLLYARISPRPQAPGEPPTRDTLLAGLRFIRSRPAILGAISMDLFAVLLGGATALLPIYARDILDVGPGGLGLLRSMPAVGALAVALWLAAHPLARRTGQRMFQAVAIFGLATMGFGLAENLVLSCIWLAVLGGADMVSVYVRQTLVQWDTPDAMRGRVAAVNSVFIGASNELGQFESGVVAALIGTVPAVVVGGAGTLVVVMLWRKWFPELAARDRLAS